MEEMTKMKVKDKRKMEVEVEVEVEKMKKIKVEHYCFSCQTYGHIISEKCIDKSVCHDCGVEGHVRRDCEEERCALKDEIKDEVKQESSESENEYVEKEVLKDEPNNDSESDSDCYIIEMKKDTTPWDVNKEYIEKEDEDKKKIKVEAYCILCQMHDHAFSEACVAKARCLACGLKGHVRRDCREEMRDFKNINVDVKKENLKFKLENVQVEVKNERITSVDVIDLSSDSDDDQAELNALRRSILSSFHTKHPRQCTNLNRKLKGACTDRNKLNCSFKMCGYCCDIVMFHEPCRGHKRK